MPKKGDTKVTHLTNEQMDNVLEAVYLDYEPKTRCMWESSWLSMRGYGVGRFAV